MGRGALDDINNHPAFIGKNHIERQEGVLHPHRDDGGPFQIEQHPRVEVHLTTIHQANGARLRGVGHFNLEAMGGPRADGDGQL